MSLEHTLRSQMTHVHGNSAARRGPAPPVAVSIHPNFRVAEPALWEMLVTRTGGVFVPAAADLLDVARLLFLADCHVKRPKSWVRDLNMKLPVRSAELWQRPEVKEVLLDLLQFVSGDHWALEFQSHALHSPPVQTRLDFGEPYRVCLMSEGLDSLSGLAQNLASNSEADFIAVTALTQKQVYGRVRGTTKQLNLQYGKRVHHVPVPLYRRDHRGRSKEEPSQRLRSFLLLSLGAVIALMKGLHSVEIYENGIEMFNFPLAPCLRPELLSRAMHPTNLALMAKFISTLTDAPFKFSAPFAFHTKGVMVQSICDKVPVEMILHTVSCIHFPQRKPGAAQCGVCSGCVLRRMALHFAGILEAANAYQSDFASGVRANTVTTSYGAMWENVYNMDQGVFRLSQGLAGPKPERELIGLSGLEYGAQQEMLRAAAEVGGVAFHQVSASLMRLYMRHTAEWQTLRPTIGVLPALAPQEYSKDRRCVI